VSLKYVYVLPKTCFRNGHNMSTDHSVTPHHPSRPPPPSTSPRDLCTQESGHLCGWQGANRALQPLSVLPEVVDCCGLAAIRQGQHIHLNACCTLHQVDTLGGHLHMHVRAGEGGGMC
jgi:hypothetical protein